MDKLLFLNFCLLDAALYATVKYFSKLSHHSTMEILSYGNIASVLILLPFALYRWKATKKGFIPNLRLFLAAPSSALKTVAVGGLSIKNVAVISYLQPAVIVMLSFMMLGEYDKKNLKQYAWLGVSFVGILIFVGFVDIRGNAMMYGLVFLHVLFKGLVNIFTKQLSDDRHTTMFYAKLHYAIFNVIIFCVMGITPSLDMFFSKATLIITAILIATQYSLIWAYKYAEKISLLQNIDYSRIFFTCLLAYLLFGESMESRQIFGLIIIVTSIILSHSGDLEMRKYSIVVLDSVKDKYKKYTNK